jgi:hypothetical protein
MARNAAAAVPTVVGSLAEKGCAQIADAPAQIKKLQALGEMAVNMGRRRLRRKVGARMTEVRRTAERAFGNGYAPVATAAPPPPAPRPAAAPPPPAAPKPPPPASPVPDAARLPIPDYDALSASQVASRLAGLSADELAAVRAYEAANRARKTVLAAVDRHRPS